MQRAQGIRCLGYRLLIDVPRAVCVRRTAIAWVVLWLSVALTLTGCTTLKRLEDENEFSVSAEPLFVSPEQLASALAGVTSDAGANPTTTQLTTIINGTTDQKKGFLGTVLIDSQRKCNTFLNRLSVAQNGVNTTGDILTTVLSGIATAIAPISLSHGFSAASTIVGGTKTALNQDLWAKAGIQDFEKALSTSYYASVRTYTGGLEQKTDVNVPLELQKIQSIHHLCTLSSARSVIDTTLSNPGQATPAPTPPAGTTSVAVPGQSIQTYTHAALPRAAAFRPDQTSTRISQWLRPTAVRVDARGTPLDASGRVAPADPVRLETLRAWLRQHGDPPIPVFLSLSEAADLRGQAIAELHIP